MMKVDREHEMMVLSALVAGEPMNTVELACAVGLGLSSSSQAASQLVIRGFVERSAGGQFKATPDGIAFEASGRRLSYRPVAKGDLRKQRVGRDTLRQRAWIAMRLRQRFTIGDLIELASRPGDVLPTNNLQRYLRELQRAAYVVRLPVRAEDSAPTSNGRVVFRLIRDTGEVAPAFTRAGVLVDHNEVPA